LAAAFSYRKEVESFEGKQDYSSSSSEKEKPKHLQPEVSEAIVLYLKYSRTFHMLTKKTRLVHSHLM